LAEKNNNVDVCYVVKAHLSYLNHFSLELNMRFFDKENILKNTEYRFESKMFTSATQSLAAEVIDLAEEWAQNYTGYPEKKTKKELRRELKKYIKDNINLKDKNKAYFLPTFVWVFLAQQLISWLVKILIEKYLMHLK